MSQGEEEIIIIGGGKRPKAADDAPWEDYAKAREMIDRAEAEGLQIRFETKE